MKTWRKQFEWMLYAGCEGDVRFISESDEDDSDLEEICRGCSVRPECIKWATTSDVSSVFVAGVRLPDPAFKKQLRSDVERLRSTYDEALVARGDF